MVCTKFVFGLPGICTVLLKNSHSLFGPNFLSLHRSCHTLKIIRQFTMRYHHGRLALLICLISDRKFAASMPNMLLVRQSCDSDSWICPDWDGLWGVLEGVSQYLLPSSQGRGDQAPTIPDVGQVYPEDQQSGNRKETNRTPSIEPAIEINVLGASDQQQQCEGLSGSEFVSVSHTLLPKKRIIFTRNKRNKKCS